MLHPSILKLTLQAIDLQLPQPQTVSLCGLRRNIGMSSSTTPECGFSPNQLAALNGHKETSPRVFGRKIMQGKLGVHLGKGIISVTWTWIVVTLESLSAYFRVLVCVRLINLLFFSLPFLLSFRFRLKWRSL